MPTRALGLRPTVIDPRVPDSRRMLSLSALPPEYCDWAADVHEVPILLNNQLSNCVEATALHVIQQRYAYALKPITVTDDDAIRLYSLWAGYNPTDPTTDRGTVMSVAMASWLANGITLEDGTVDKIEGYASVSVRNVTNVQRAIWLTGSVLVGIDCPKKWLTADFVMDLEDDEPIDSAGGHGLMFAGYLPTALGLEYVVHTWEGRFRMTQRAFSRVAQEAYCITSRDWVDSQGLNPALIAWDDVSAAMSQIAAA